MGPKRTLMPGEAAHTGRGCSHLERLPLGPFCTPPTTKSEAPGVRFFLVENIQNWEMLILATFLKLQQHQACGPQVNALALPHSCPSYTQPRLPPTAPRHTQS